MGMLTDIRVPLPEEHRSASARLRFAHETSERVFSNLRARLGDDFRVEAQPRSVAFGDSWSREADVYRGSVLCARFAVSWDATRSPDALEVSCLLPGEAPAVSRVPALAASLALAAGSTVLAGPVVGGLVLLAAGGVVAATAAWRSGTDRDEALLDAFEQQPNRIGLEPLLG